MKSLTDILAIVIAIAALGFALYEFYNFVEYPDPQGGYHHLWLSIGAVVIAIAGALYYFLRHVNKEEEIHITQ